MASSIAVEIRESKGKGAARKLRATGGIPAVLYGHGNDPTSLSVDARTLELLLRNSDAGQNTLIDLEGASTVAGKTVIVKELQRDPVSGNLMHADLYVVDVNEAIVVSVPLHMVGIPEGVSLGGGLLDQALRELELECLPGAIPKELPVDVAPLQLGESLHVRDVPLPDGVTLRTDGDLSVVSVVAPSVTEDEPVAAAGEGEAAAEGEGEAGEPGESGDKADAGSESKDS